MRDCARLTRRPTRLAFGAAPHGPLSKRVTKARGSQQQSLNACWARLSSRHAHARSLWNTSRKNRLVSMVGAGDSNSDLQFACSSGSEEMQRRGREEMPRIPAPPTAADGLDTAAGGWAFRSVFKRNDPYGDAEKLFAA